MINLEEYKNVLVNTYRYEIDNSESKKEERRELLNRRYNDEYLNKIITDTYHVIKNIFDISENGYCNISMDDDTTCYISLNLIGGYSSDILYIDSYGNIISRYILKETFGNLFSITVKEIEYDFAEDDPDIMSFDYSYSLYLQNFPPNMKEIKENLFGTSKIKK